MKKILNNFNNLTLRVNTQTDLELKKMIYGAIAAIMGILFLYTIFTLNIFNVGSGDMGFIDPSTSFAESLIRLYNFIGSFLFLILVIVLMLMGRIIYLFNGNSQIERNKIINKIILFFFKLFLEIVLIINDKKLISNCLYKINELNINSSNELNIGYSDYKKNEFLLISDLAEYKQLEFIGCILPAIVLCMIAGPSFSLVFSLDSAVDPEINIKVVGKQWYGVYSFDNLVESFDQNFTEKSIAFSYDSVMLNEDDLLKGTHRLLEADNRLLVPTGVPIRFLITSTDVLHSWAIPSLGLKADAIPGRLSQFIVEIKKPGVFYGQCSELCGPMHGFMPIILQAITYGDYVIGLNTL